MPSSSSSSNSTAERALVTETANLSKQIRSIQVRDKESLEIANDFLHKLKEVEEKAREFFSPLIKSAHAAWKAVLAAQAKILDPIEQQDDVLRTRVNRYLTEQEQAKQAALAEQQRKEEEYQAKLEKAKQPSRVKPPEPVEIPVMVQAEGLSQRKVPRWKPVNLALVPDELWILDERKINQLIRSGVREIPGLEIWEEIESVLR